MPDDHRKLTRRFVKRHEKYVVEHERRKRKRARAMRRNIRRKIRKALRLAQSLKQNMPTAEDQQIPDSFKCVHCDNTIQKADNHPWAC
jgi:phage terminase small subunit